jgi:sporulation protein YqfC
MKKRLGVYKKLRQSLELDDILSERDEIFMMGTEELTVREVGRILKYSEEEIRLALHSYILRVIGKELYCASYLGGTVRVSGRIASLEFEVRGKRK